jgi:hypothetical protein
VVAGTAVVGTVARSCSKRRRRRSTSSMSVERRRLELATWSKPRAC